MNSTVVSKYRAEIARLEGEIAHYEQQWSKVLHFAWVALLTPVAGIVSGWGAAVATLLVSLALVGVRAYLIAMRKGEAEWTRNRLLEDLGEAAGPRSAVAAHGQPV
jgi:hypothetical protein